jgi:hypothetical protein
MEDNKFTIYMKSDLDVEFEDPRWDDLITYCEAALTKYIDIEKLDIDRDVNLDHDLRQYLFERCFMVHVTDDLKKYGNWTHIEESVAESILSTTCEFIRKYSTNYDVQDVDWNLNDLDDFWIEINGEEF